MKLDRYIIKQFFMIFLFSLIALSMIFVIVNLMEKLDNFMDQDTDTIVIIKYYLYFLPSIIKLLMPVSVLLGILFTIGRLSQSNEITVMKASGISLYRIMLPFLIFTSFLSVGMLYFSGWILPEATRLKTEIELEYLKHNSSRGPIYNLYFRDSPNRNLLMQYYNSKTKLGSNIAIEDYSSQEYPRLKQRIEAKSIKWDSVNNNWLLRNVIIRKYSNNKFITQVLDSLKYELNIKHKQLVRLKMKSDEMNFSELKEYINILKLGGKDVSKQMIDYYGGYAFPFANLIVVLFAVPFASIKRRGGIAVQVGAALVISFIYIISQKISLTIGYSSGWDPILAGWMANIVFLFIGIFITLRVKS